MISSISSFCAASMTMRSHHSHRSSVGSTHSSSKREDEEPNKEETRKIKTPREKIVSRRYVLPYFN